MLLLIVLQYMFAVGSFGGGLLYVLVNGGCITCVVFGVVFWLHCVV